MHEGCEIELASRGHQPRTTVGTRYALTKGMNSIWKHTETARRDSQHTTGTIYETHTKKRQLQHLPYMHVCVVWAGQKGVPTWKEQHDLHTTTLASFDPQNKQI